MALRGATKSRVLAEAKAKFLNSCNRRKGGVAMARMQLALSHPIIRNRRRAERNRSRAKPSIDRNHRPPQASRQKAMRRYHFGVSVADSGIFARALNHARVPRMRGGIISDMASREKYYSAASARQIAQLIFNSGVAAE